jgi:hypothetical protein
MIGFHELGKSTYEVEKQFKGDISDQYIERVKHEVGVL